MLIAVMSGGAIVGTKTAVALMSGGISVLLGFVGFAMLLVGARQMSPAGKTGHRFLTIASALLVVVGGVALLSGIISPLKRIVKQPAVNTRQAAVNTELLTRIAQLQAELAVVVKAMHSEQNAELRHLSRMQCDQLTRMILSEPKRQDPKRLNKHEYKVTSQNGEDGIIAEIFERIGTTNRCFVEFGASSGAENNTALLVRQGWSGLWMDADTAAVTQAKAAFRAEIDSGKLIVLETFITAENIEDLFRKGSVPEEPDLLSIDIDRNDYYVWEKITHFRPRVVIVEYNAGVPATMPWKVDYDPKAFGWTSFGNGNGASLKALEELGASKGYRLVGCDLCGVNAFFVRDDLLGDHFAAPYTAENHYEPCRAAYLLGVYPPDRSR